MARSHTPHRIACLQPSATVILASVGGLDRVVACTKYCADVVPEVLARKLTILADSWTSKAEEIVAVAPDLIIAAVPYQPASVAEILKAGIRFLGLAPHTLLDIYADVAVISGLVDANARGDQVIAHMQTSIENIRRQTTQLPKRRVYCEEWGKPLITSQPWVKELIEAAGGEFIGEPGKQISAEQVVDCDPEIVIASWCGAGSRVPLQKIIRERAWLQTTAARTNQVYCVSDELLNTPAPTLIDGLHAIAAAVHPETFPRVPGLLSIAETRSRDAASHGVV
jgi:iron complex transport system substrate-binding protein